MAPKSTVTLKEGWPIIQDGISKIIHEINTKNRTITEKDYMNIYTTSFNICVYSIAESQKLYERLHQVYEDYISFAILPCLKGKKDESLLEEVVNKWENQKYMARFISRFCRYLDRYYIPSHDLPTLQETSYIAFHKLVVIGFQVTDSLMRMIKRQRKKSGVNQIDQGLLKNVVDMYLEIGNIKSYGVANFEEKMLKETRKFYSVKALNWINSSDSYIDFMMKVEECMKNEKERIAICLQDNTKYNLLKAVEHELMSVHAIKLEKMKQNEYESYVLVEAMDGKLEEMHI